MVIPIQNKNQMKKINLPISLCELIWLFALFNKLSTKVKLPLSVQFPL